MTDRPILFSAAMIRALLAGTKTQTRRLIKPRHNPNRPNLFDGTWSDNYVLDPGNQKWRDDAYPWRIGDRLWVRETVRAVDDENTFGHQIEYLADGARRTVAEYGDVSSDAYGDWWALLAYRSDDPDLTGGKKVPPIHMPRWASRLTLVVETVKVERLQDINTADAIDEGIEKDHAVGMPNIWGWHDYLRGNDLAKRHFSDPRESYRTLWNSINGPGSWEANPWVVALTFTVHRQNIDAMKEAA